MRHSSMNLDEIRKPHSSESIPGVEDDDGNDFRAKRLMVPS